jgi:hypothetical protein
MTGRGFHKLRQTKSPVKEQSPRVAAKCSLKGKVKKKTPPRLKFSAFSAHLIEQDLF